MTSVLIIAGRLYKSLYIAYTSHVQDKAQSISLTTPFTFNTIAATGSAVSQAEQHKEHAPHHSVATPGGYPVWHIESVAQIVAPKARFISRKFDANVGAVCVCCVCECAACVRVSHSH